MLYYAVIDTNVILASMLTKNYDSATVKIMRAVFTKKIIPMYNDDILSEYHDVLSRDKFHLRYYRVSKMLTAIQLFGLEVQPVSTGTILPDTDDLIFYETAAAIENAYLITGNKKHFPNVDFAVSPAEMMRIMSHDITA